MPKKSLSKRRRERIWEMYCKESLHSPSAIAARLEKEALGTITRQAVFKVLESIRAELHEDCKDAAKREATHQLNALSIQASEAMRAWEESKKAQRTVKAKADTSAGLASDAEVDDITIRDACGDPRFLEQARRALADRRKILGIEAATRVKVDATVEVSEGQASIRDFLLKVASPEEVAFLDAMGERFPEGPEFVIGWAVVEMRVRAREAGQPMPALEFPGQPDLLKPTPLQSVVVGRRDGEGRGATTHPPSARDGVSVERGASDWPNCTEYEEAQKLPSEKREKGEAKAFFAWMMRREREVKTEANRELLAKVWEKEVEHYVEVAVKHGAKVKNRGASGIIYTDALHAGSPDEGFACHAGAGGDMSLRELGFDV